MREFPASPITALIDGSPQYDLGESYAPHLSVADILDPAELAWPEPRVRDVGR